jgi:F420 biosynthesis protein FbiB-like protein
MPDLFEAIMQRRSIRKYQDRPVPKKVIEEVLVAASWAPSAHNAQPWRFVILEDQAVKREFSEAMAQAWAADLSRDGVKVDGEKFKARVERFAIAPALILVCITMEGMAKQPDLERLGVERDSAVASLGAGLENLLLAAYAAGLGACWFCAPAFCKDEVRKTLSIPVDVEPQALVLMGYPAELPQAPLRKTLDEIAFKNHWGRQF